MTSTGSLSVGIDLGTTYSCIGVYRHGRVEIIPNLDGSRTTPSVVAFTETARLVGEPAKNQAAMNPKNTVYDVKRIIGQAFSEPAVQMEMQHLSYTVEAGPEGQPRIRVSGDRVFSPEEISAMVLASLKEAAEKYLGSPVTSAVITVPAYFNDAQRQATKTAGRIAGLDVLRIINEPTSAALAYGLERWGDLKRVDKYESQQHLVVVDLGGGTFDCTLLCVEEGVFEVLATSGDLHLGGEDFDGRLVDFLSQEFKRRHGVDLKGNHRALRRLRNACEKAKRVLSSAAQANIEIDALAEGIDYSTLLSRARFEELCADLFKSILVPIENVLRDGGKAKQDIDEVILVGGSTRIPKVQALVREFFGGKALCTSINADESIAYGAAVQAALLTENATQRDSRIESMVLLDVCPLSIGVEVAGERMAVLVPRNTTIPTEKQQLFSTATDNQTSVLVQVYEGERQFTRDCRLLGKFQLEGIPPAPKGTAQIEVKFEIDANGILNVSAVEKSTGRRNQVVITNQRGSLSDADVKRMIGDAERYAEQDRAELERVQARSHLENYAWGVRSSLGEQALQQKLSSDELTQLTRATNETVAWLDSNLSASTSEFQAQQKQLESTCRPILDKAMRASAAPPPPSAPVSQSKPIFKPPMIEEN